MLKPSFRNFASGRTCTLTYKSPGEPAVIASPIPDMRMTCPFSMPAGETMVISSAFLSTPEPRQCVQGFSGTTRFPLQVWQVDVTENTPNGERRDSTTWPLPLQVGQVFVLVSGSAPEPEHREHALSFVSNTFRVTPKIDSRNESSISIEMSRPRLARALPPPNISENPPKMSLRSISKPAS